MMKWLLILAGIACVPFIVGMVAFGVFNSPKMNGVKAFDQSVSKQYYHDDENVYFVRGSNFFELGKQHMESAELNSFTVLSNSYAKDNQQVFFSGEVIPGADPHAFQLLLPSGVDSSTQNESFYSRDDQQVFFFSQLMETADPASYTNIGGGYAVDKQQFYYDGKPMSVDAANYKYLGAEDGYAYLAINERVYFQGDLLAGAVPSGFTLLAKGFVKDSSHVFYRGDLVKGADVASFEIVNEVIQKDHQRMFYQAEPLPFGDPATAKDVNGYFWKDKDSVYEVDTRLLDVNPNWFSKIDAEDFGAYKYQEVKIDEHNSRYIKRSKLDWLSDGYFTYEGAVYHHAQGRLDVGSVVDVRSFDDAFAGWYIVINDKAFYGNTVIEGADASHFKPLRQNFSTDGQTLFWNVHPVIDANPDEFKVDEAGFPEQGEDGRYYLKKT
ncbi:DKNYY domain-containing protein [Pseudomaricurvus sp.]|uniref:DKNYY domain-containing protein n=1 Tax=Pseudomaricurvus sp. TaxID=2004510 RepID=UPI003F6C05AB